MISVLYLLRGAAMPNARTRVRLRLEESVKKQAETIFPSLSPRKRYVP